MGACVAPTRKDMERVLYPVVNKNSIFEYVCFKERKKRFILEKLKELRDKRERRVSARP